MKPRFALGPVLAPSIPKPPRPPGGLGYGGSCFRAECFLQSDEILLATFSGYDQDLGVVDAVETACRRYIGTHRHSGETPAATCGPAKLTFLSHFTQECSGQMYFTMNTSSSPQRRCL